MDAMPGQFSFTTGQISSKVQGRVDLDRYKSALDLMLNWLPTVQGGAIKRSATFYVAAVKNSTHNTKLIEFVYNNQQSYILEFGNLYMRVYRDQAQVLSGGLPYEIVTPYAHADVPAIKVFQSADTMFLLHPSYPVKLLTRTGHTAWTITNLTFFNGPYLPENRTATTLTPSGTTGSITLTASSIVGINGGTGFQTTDVGRDVQLVSGAVHTWATITARTSTTLVTVLIKGANLPGAAAFATWSLGAYSATTGYPSTGCLFQLRLWLAGSPAAPQQIDGSQIDDFGNFQRTDSTGTAADDDAISGVVDASDVIKHLVQVDKGIYTLMSDSERLAKGNGDDIITPTSFRVPLQGNYGSSDIQPILVGDAIIFIQGRNRKVREALFDFYTEKYRAGDLTVLADELTFSGIADMTMQKEKQPVLWLAMNDGTCRSMTYDRDGQTLRVGWATHQFGGRYTAGGAPTRTLSLASIASSFSPYTEVWMINKRLINGSLVQHVELLTDLWEEGFERDTAFYLDAGLQRTDYSSISNISISVPGVITVTTSAAHFLTTGDKVSVDSVLGTTALNHNVFTVTVTSSTAFTIDEVDGSGYEVYAGGGRVIEHATFFSGLTHLAGETIALLADGAAVEGVVVNGSGQFTLENSAGFVAVGLPYTADMRLLPFDAGNVMGSSMGSMKFTNRVILMVHETARLKVGFGGPNRFASAAEFFEAEREDETELTEAAAVFGPPLYTGFFAAATESGWTMGSQVCVRSDQPYPATILLIRPELSVNR